MTSSQDKDGPTGHLHSWDHWDDLVDPLGTSHVDTDAQPSRPTTLSEKEDLQNYETEMPSFQQGYADIIVPFGNADTDARPSPPTAPPQRGQPEEEQPPNPIDRHETETLSSRPPIDAIEPSATPLSASLPTTYPQPILPDQQGKTNHVRVWLDRQPPHNNLLALGSDIPSPVDLDHIQPRPFRGNAPEQSQNGNGNELDGQGQERQNGALDYASNLEAEEPYLQRLRTQALATEELENIDATLAMSQPGRPSAPGYIFGQMLHQNYLDGSNLVYPLFNAGISQEEEEEKTKLESFARLRFEDSTVYINTYAAIIGRDNKVWKMARAQSKYDREVATNAEQGLPPPDLPRELRRNYPQSFEVISKQGGTVAPPDSESDGDDNPRPRKRRKTKAHVSDSRQAREDATGPAARHNIISSRQYVDHTPGAAPLDVSALRPSPNAIPVVRIHGPGDRAEDIVKTTKGISREHVKIQFNPDEEVWEAVGTGRNGFFIADDFVNKGQKVVLKCGDRIQIQSVVCGFYISGVKEGKTCPDPSSYSEGGKEMSFDFESSRGNGVEMRDTEDEISDDDQQPLDRMAIDSDDEDEEMEDVASPQTRGQEDGQNGEAEGDVMETVESDPVNDDSKLDASPEAGTSVQPLLPPKKRGPGRPPKNGIMSKRQERELKKQQQEELKKNMPPPQPGEQPVKRPVGRPRKHPLPENSGDQPEKRKYKPRKSKAEDGEETPDAEKPVKEKRPAKPKTPPLELRREDFTEEQLQKPNKNYCTLLDEVLTAALPEGLTLKQIYKRIMQAHPYFYFRVESKGWESSVRHNLLACECFKKNDDEHLWYRVPGIPLESGKKRKPSDSNGDLRPAPMYNNYSNTQQPPPLSQTYPNQIPNATGFPQANLPPRYPPNGQAYPPHQGPASNLSQPGAAPIQQASMRQHLPQQHAPMATPQPNVHGPAGAVSRPQYPGTQQPPYNPAYGNRPLSAYHANPGVTGAATTLQSRPQPALVVGPGQGPPPATPQHGHSPYQAAPSHTTLRATPAPHQQQQASNDTAQTPLRHAVDPTLVAFVKGFSLEVSKQLRQRGVDRPEAVAMSIVNRGLRLTNRSLTPEHKALEDVIYEVFEQHKLGYPKFRAGRAERSGTASPAAAAAPVNGNAAATVGTAQVTGTALAPASTTSAPASGIAALPASNGSTAANGYVSSTATVNGTAMNVNSGPGNAESAAPRPATAGAAPNASGAATQTATPGLVAAGTASAGSSTGAPATNGNLPNGSRSTPVQATTAPPPAAAAAAAAQEVQFLDPKMVELLMGFKKEMQEVLNDRIGEQMSEVLIMSSVNRVLGFAESTICNAKTEQEKRDYLAAEMTAMQALDSRIRYYQRTGNTLSHGTQASQR